MALRAGPTAAAISGSLEARASIPPAISATSTTFGSSILPRSEWAWMGGSSAIGSDCPNFIKRTYVALLVCTARWERLPPEISQEAAISLQAGPISSGHLWLFGGLATMTEILAISTTFGSSILPRRNGHGWAEAALPALTKASPECTARWEACCWKHPWKPQWRFGLDRQQRPPLALWGRRLRRQRTRGQSQRPLGVQSFHERMGVDRRKQHGRKHLRPIRILWANRSVRHVGNACRRKRPWRPIRSCELDRSAAVTSGSLGASVSTPMPIMPISTTFGSSIHPQMNGLGGAEAALPAAITASTECTARWGRLLPGTLPDAAGKLRAGPTAAAISGSLVAMAAMPRELLANSTTFGSSILPRTNGRGWAEAVRYPAVAKASPECTAHWATPAAGNIPGGRNHATSWTDSSGHFWLFGGKGFDSNGIRGHFNDLWKYQLAPSAPKEAKP